MDRDSGRLHVRVGSADEVVQRVCRNRPRAERFVLPGGVAGGRPVTLLVAGRAFSSGCSAPSSKLRRLEGTASWLSASDQQALLFGHPGGNAGTSLVHQLGRRCCRPLRRPSLYLYRLLVL